MKYTKKSLRRRRNTDKWEVGLYQINEQTGETKTIYRTVNAKDRDEAIEQQCKLIIDLESADKAASCGISVDKLLEDYLDICESSRSIEKSTLMHYKKDARRISHYIGDVDISKVNMDLLVKWIGDMNNDSLAPRTVAKPYRLLKQAMEFAVDKEYIAKNPCVKIKLPKIDKKDVNPLSSAERARMIELVTKPPRNSLKLAIHIALATGMRRGEICALRWSDIDVKNKTITVNRALGEKKGGWYVKPPKTKASRRTLPLTDDLFNILECIHEQSRITAKDFHFDLGDPYILGTQEPDSKPYNPVRLTHDFKAFSDAEGFGITFHDLRHTFATMLIAAGTDIVLVSSLLGHDKTSTTLDIYGEVDPDAKKDVKGTIERVMKPSSTEINSTASTNNGHLQNPIDETLLENVVLNVMQKALQNIKDASGQ